MYRLIDLPNWKSLSSIYPLNIKHIMVENKNTTCKIFTTISILRVASNFYLKPLHYLASRYNIQITV